MAKKLRQQMQKTLKKTAEELKQGEEVKVREQIRERKVIFYLLLIFKKKKIFFNINYINYFTILAA